MFSDHRLLKSLDCLPFHTSPEIDGGASVSFRLKRIHVAAFCLKLRVGIREILIERRSLFDPLWSIVTVESHPLSLYHTKTRSRYHIVEISLSFSPIRLHTVLDHRVVRGPGFKSRFSPQTEKIQELYVNHFVAKVMIFSAM